MNEYDSKKILFFFQKYNFEKTKNKKDASIVIYNTCNIRKKSSDKLYSEIGKLKNKNKKIIIVAGCIAQAEGEEIIKKNNDVNIVVGPQSYYILPKIIKEIRRKSYKIINVKFNVKKKFDFVSIKNTKYSEYVVAQEGCNKFCSFCCVPYTRGQEYSRNINNIYQEVMVLVSYGVKEIILLGQNISSYYCKDKNSKIKGLEYLIKSISKIKKIKRIRYLTSHPIDIRNKKIVNCHLNKKKLMPFLHIPVQSGSNKILKKMNRRHNIKYYLNIIKKFKKSKKIISITSDFIVGYPGETKEDFQLTLDLIIDIGYMKCFFFKYSIRPGTPSSIEYNQIRNNIKVKRISIVGYISRKKGMKFNKFFINKKIMVMIEKKRSSSKYYWGKSQFYQNVIVISELNVLGKIKKIKIVKQEKDVVYGYV